MRGKEAIYTYLAGKIETLKRAQDSMIVRMELGQHDWIGSCVVVFQVKKSESRRFENKPVALMEIRIGGDGKISRFLMITAVPPADEVSRNHIYPALQIVDVWLEPENDIDS